MTSFLRWVKDVLRNIRRQPTPLRTHYDDIRLIQRVHGRVFPRLNQLWHIGRILSSVERRVILGSMVVGIVGIFWLLALVGRQYRVNVPAVGGRYVEGVIGTPDLVNPLFASRNDVDTDIARLVYTGLMRYDEKQRLVPDLAVNVSISEDKKIYTFDLRRDALWHDGEAFSVRDVVFTMETIQNSTVGSPLLVSFQGVQVAALDEDTVQFTLKDPFAPFLSVLTVGIIPEHIWSDVPADRIRLHKQNLQAIGTGPFKFKKLLKDETGYVYRYELIRNDRWYRQPPYIEEFVFQFFTDFEGPTGMIQALREGKVDGLSFVPHDVKDRVERKHTLIHTLQLPQYTALFFNQDHDTAMKSKELRTALEMALDKDRILKEALSGEGEVIHGPILSGFPGYLEDATTTEYALDEANTLLDGVTTRILATEYRMARRSALMAEFASSTTSTVLMDATTINAFIDERLGKELNDAQVFYRKDKQGSIIELTLVTADTSEYKQVAELIVGFWQDIGIKTVVELIAPKEIGRSVLKSREYDVLLYGLILGGDPDQYPFWHSSQIDFPGLNLSRYVNRNVDALLIKAREMANPEEAAGIYRKFEEAILSDLPAIFLFTPTYTYATTDRVFGVAAAHIFHPSDRLNGAGLWYMKTESAWQKN